jgi:hypothetical protein
LVALANLEPWSSAYLRAAGTQQSLYIQSGEAICMMTKVKKFLSSQLNKWG